MSLLIAIAIGQMMGQERDVEIAKAMIAVKAEMQRAEEDKDRPAFHYHAPAQWMNDPNGPIYYKGWYHVFYQFNPFGDRWGNMHWGHARTRDLVDWEDLPIALWPSKMAGEDHVFSGSSYLAPGPLGARTPTAFYTSISGRRSPEQWAAAAEDDALIRWRKLPENPILTSDLQEWRDPFLFAVGGQVYLITGGGKGGRGVVALYKSLDSGLRKWQPAGILFEHPDANVANIECPNLTRINGKWLLLVSVHGRVESFVGQLSGAMQFRTETRGVLNEGSYASQLLSDSRRRLIHLAWVPTDNHRGWNGFLTLPSELRISDKGDVIRTPIRELQKLRGEKVELHDLDVAGELNLSPKVSGDLLEIKARVDGQRGGFTVRLRRSADGARAVDLSYPGSAVGTPIHVYLDRGVVEDFEGTSRTEKFSARPEDLGMSVIAKGGAVHIKSLVIYHLRPAKFDRSAFHMPQSRN